MKINREYSEEEVKNMFLDKLRTLVNYWDMQEHSSKGKLEGLAFSILTTIDGCSDMPQFILAPLPHKDDKDYSISEGQKYFPENHNSKVNCNISGELHELFY